MNHDDLESRLRDARAPRMVVQASAVHARAQRRRGRRAGAVGMVAALGLVGATGLGAWLAPRQQPPTSTPAASVSLPPLTCPSTVPTPGVGGRGAFELAPPAPPTGFDGDARLIPDADPTSGVICRYQPVNSAAVEPGNTPSALPLEKTGTFGAGQTPGLELLAFTGRVPEGQEWLRGHTEVGGPSVPYLLGLDYGEGRRVWVAGVDDPNGASTMTNGRFVAAGTLGDRLHTMTGVAAPATKDPCWVGGSRLGSDTALVPPGVTGATVCHEKPTRQLSAASATRLADSLNASGVRGRTTSPGCTEPPDRQERVVFHYDRGPDVQVMWSDRCSPQAWNSLAAADTIDITAVTDIVSGG